MLPLKVLLNSLGWAAGGVLSILLLAHIYVTVIKTLNKYSGEDTSEDEQRAPQSYHGSTRYPYLRHGMSSNNGSYNGSVESGQLPRPLYPGEPMNLTTTAPPTYPNKSRASTQDQDKDYEDYSTEGPEDTSSSPYLFQPIRYQNVVKRSVYREYKDG